ncbi:sensor histidine kinase [Propionicimonas sp.]|uniref:sensor histidine kinase n=1 Tax=Propionicimonas sp. TaxID=1955623 RepID=UPI0039E5F692
MTRPVQLSDADLRAHLAPPGNPLRIFASPLAWRSVLYCLTSMVAGLAALVAGIVGVLVLPLVTWVTANVERVRLVVLGLPRLSPLPRSRVRHPWDLRGLKDGNLSVWGITVLFGLIDLVPGTAWAGAVSSLIRSLVIVYSAPAAPLDRVLSVVGLLLVVMGGLYGAWALASAQALVIDLQLRPYSELSRKVDELTTSRRELVDVFAAERRRIEQDLHDGAQQHLVLLAMHLGEADYALDQGRPDDARAALELARGSVEAAMTSLRDTVRGIHPQILTDRGLAAAVRELAERQPMPVRVEISGSAEPGEQLTLAAYYLVSEAFTNIVKHSGASAAAVRLVLADPLEVEVYDDGRGGAVVRPGHGLSGLVERARAVGGDCWLTSPPGGPTLVRATFPNPKERR